MSVCVPLATTWSVFTLRALVACLNQVWLRESAPESRLDLTSRVSVGFAFGAGWYLGSGFLRCWLGGVATKLGWVGAGQSSIGSGFLVSKLVGFVRCHFDQVGWFS